MQQLQRPLTPWVRNAGLVLVWLILAGPLGSQVLAGSVLNFPRLTFGPGALTGIAIVNPTEAAAVVTLTAFGADGLLLPGITNPVHATIGANEQFSALTSELFGTALDPETVAWFQATSDVVGLTGFFLFLDGTISQLDGADLPVAAQKIVFRQVRLDAGHTTELNLVNPQDTPARLQLQLVRADQSVVVQTLALPPMAAARLDVGHLLWRFSRAGDRRRLCGGRIRRSRRCRL